MSNLSSISQDTGKAKHSEKDPDEIVRMMEEELARQRAKWQRVSAQRSTLRAASLLFLLAIAGIAFIGFFYYFTQGVHPSRSNNVKKPEATASPNHR